MAPARTALITAALVATTLVGVGYANVAGSAAARAETVPTLGASAASDGSSPAAAGVAHAETIAGAAAVRQREARAERARLALQQAQNDPRSIARAQVGQYNWGEEEFVCLDKLWTRESQWRFDADNPSSSAYGIPQALPGAKMAAAGADWETNPATQIAWGLGYIDDIYGSPCGAWGHSESHNWY